MSWRRVERLRSASGRQAASSESPRVGAVKRQPSALIDLVTEVGAVDVADRELPSAQEGLGVERAPFLVVPALTLGEVGDSAVGVQLRVEVAGEAVCVERSGDAARRFADDSLLSRTHERRLLLSSVSAASTAAWCAARISRAVWFGEGMRRANALGSESTKSNPPTGLSSRVIVLGGPSFWVRMGTVMRRALTTLRSRLPVKGWTPSRSGSSCPGERLGFHVVGRRRDVRDALDPGPKVRGGLRELDHPEPLEALDDQPDGPVGLLEHPVNGRDRADPVEVLRRRRFLGGVVLRDEADQASAEHGLVHRADGRRPRDRQRDHRLREQHGLPERQNGQLVRLARVGPRGSARTRRAGFDPDICLVHTVSSGIARLRGPPASARDWSRSHISWHRVHRTAKGCARSRAGAISSSHASQRP